MSKYSEFERFQIEAISDKVVKTDMFFYRKICRWYSEKFHTPLHEVMEGKVVLWADILQHYYEDQFDSLSHNESMDLLMREYLPEFVDKFEKEDEAFAESLVEEQRKTIERKKKKEQEKKKKEQEKKKKEQEKKKEVEDKILPPPMNFNFDLEE